MWHEARWGQDDGWHAIVLSAKRVSQAIGSGDGWSDNDGAKEVLGKKHRNFRMRPAHMHSRTSG